MEKRYDHKKIEREMQNFWKQNDIYRFEPEGDGEIYSIDTPPPTVSGSLHIGHIFSYAQAEMIARYKRMRGYRVFYPLGFDDNGLPTERLTEKELGVSASEMERRDFIKHCRKTADKYEAEFESLFELMGFSFDYALRYQTGSDETVRLSQKLFLDLARSKKAYQKDAPVLWCPHCQTSIAQAELETLDSDTKFVYLPFKTEIGTLQVATTRPELLYGCVCLFVHPDDERYIDYIGHKATVPLYDFTIPIYSDSSVDKEKGTGVVMCATFGDSQDAAWYMQHALPLP